MTIQTIELEKLQLIKNKNLWSSNQMKMANNIQKSIKYLGELINKDKKRIKKGGVNQIHNYISKIFSLKDLQKMKY